MVYHPVPGLVIWPPLAPFRNLDRRLLVLACSALSTFAGYFLFPSTRDSAGAIATPPGLSCLSWPLPQLAPGRRLHSLRNKDASSSRRAQHAVLLPFKAFIMLCYTGITGASCRPITAPE